MAVLDQQRPAVLAPVALARFTHRARWGIGPERAIVRLAVVVAGEAEHRGEDQDQHRGRKTEWKPARPPARLLGLNPGMVTLGVVDQRRMKRRQVRSDRRVIRL